MSRSYKYSSTSLWRLSVKIYECPAGQPDVRTERWRRSFVYALWSCPLCKGRIIKELTYGTLAFASNSKTEWEFESRKLRRQTHTLSAVWSHPVKGAGVGPEWCDSGGLQHQLSDRPSVSAFPPPQLFVNSIY